MRHIKALSLAPALDVLAATHDRITLLVYAATEPERLLVLRFTEVPSAAFLAAWGLLIFRSTRNGPIRGPPWSTSVFASSVMSGSARLMPERWSLAPSDPRGLCEGRRKADPANIRPAGHATVDVDDLSNHRRRVDPAGDLCGCVEGISTASIMPARSGE